VSPARRSLREQYEEAFRAYLRDPGEHGLQRAYELGRQAVQVGLSILELADSHHDVLTSELAGTTGGRAAAALAESARVFLNETLSTFDMASRGFKEASEAVRLEHRHSERLRQLADAFLELNRSIRPEEILVVVTARARAVHDVASVRARLVLGDDEDLAGPEQQVIDVLDGAPVAIEDRLADAALVARRPVRGEGAAGRTLVAPLLRAGGPPAGVIQLSGPASGAFTDQDEAMVVQFASMTAIAVENAQRFQHERWVAATLQQSLLPQDVHETGRGLVAVRYRAGGEGVDVGGDFYDVVAPDAHRLGLALGDVMGKGVHAAATMGQLRMALRAYASDGRAPSEVVAGLDRLMASLRVDAFATMAYLDLDLVQETGRLTIAGHPPPVLRTPDGAVRLLDGPSTRPLGLIGAEVPPEVAVAVPAGSLVVLYSDGLVEGRDLPLDEGLGRLLEEVRVGPESPEGMCDHLLRTMSDLAGHDDTALLVLRAAPPRRPVSPSSDPARS
jgi:serine phosphatase RsbU (regulator of sigma subunit)